MKLWIQAIAASLSGLVFFGLFLFGPAGTFRYWEAWVFIAIFTAVSSGPTMYWGLRKPEVLRRRMHAGPIAETRTVQKIATVGTIATVVAMLVVSAFDHRFGWSQVPTPIVVAGEVLVAVGLGVATMVVNSRLIGATAQSASTPWLATTRTQTSGATPGPGSSVTTASNQATLPGSVPERPKTVLTQT